MVTRALRKHSLRRSVHPWGHGLLPGGRQARELWSHFFVKHIQLRPSARLMSLLAASDPLGRWRAGGSTVRDLA